MHCLGLKCLPSLVYTSAMGVLRCNFRNFPFLSATYKISPSTRIPSVANRVCEGVDICRSPSASPQQTLLYSLTFCTKLCMISDVYGLLPSTVYGLVPSTVYGLVPSTVYGLLPSTVYGLLPSNVYGLVPSTVYGLLPSTVYGLLPSTVYGLLQVLFMA